MRPSRERAARAALSAVVEPGTVDVARRVAQIGAAATWAGITGGDSTIDRRGVLERRSRSVDGSAILARATELGLRFVCPGDPDWPAALEPMAATLMAGVDAVPPPFGLWLRGKAALDYLGRSVAVVGARAASAYGGRVAADMAAELGTLGWAVVSGAAFGIDAAAHRGALAMGGTTVAVLACGLDICYPRAHGELLDTIAANGLIISELAPGMRPMRSRFLARNRIIAGLTSGTVVVEAARRSGALNTAHWAVKLGREVLAVPGPVTSGLSAGCHEWIRDRGATLVTDAREVVDAVGIMGADAAPAAQVPERPLDHFDPDVRHVYETMPSSGAVTVATLAHQSGYIEPFVAAALRRLAEDGLVTEGVDGWARVPGAAS